jgi:adenylylsulfate kinase-like enzyme
MKDGYVMQCRVGLWQSTVANAVDKLLTDAGRHSYILDGDNLRCGLNSDLGFSAADRKENVRRVGEVAKLFADAGLIVLVPLISPYREDRDSVRAKLPEGAFVEVAFLGRAPLRPPPQTDSQTLRALLIFQLRFL